MSSADDKSLINAMIGVIGALVVFFFVALFLADMISEQHGNPGQTPVFSDTKK